MNSMLLTLRMGIILIEAIVIFILINAGAMTFTSLFKGLLIILILDGMISNIKFLLSKKRF